MELNNFGYYWLDTWVMANVIQLATHLSSMHILAQKRKFDHWLKSL